MSRIAIVIIQPQINKALRLQLRKLCVLQHQFSKDTIVQSYVIHSQAATPELTSLCEPTIRLRRSLPYYLIPPSIYRNYDLVVFIPNGVLPSFADLVFLINQATAVTILGLRHTNISSFFSSATSGLCAFRPAMLKPPKKHRKKIHQQSRTYKEVSAPERLALTAHTRQQNLTQEAGQSRQLLRAPLWQSYRILGAVFNNLLNERPLPALAAKPVHFRLPVAQFSLLLAFLYYPLWWFWVFWGFSFIMLLDYFWPADENRLKSFKYLPMRLLFLFFA